MNVRGFMAIRYLNMLFNSLPYIDSIDNNNIYFIKENRKIPVSHETFINNNTLLNDMIKELKNIYEGL